MGRDIKVIGIRNQNPDVRLLVLAVLEYARELQEEEEKEQLKRSSQADKSEEDEE